MPQDRRCDDALIGAQVHQGVGVVDGHEGDDDVHVVADPVVPEVGKTKLQRRMPRGCGQFAGPLRRLAGIDFVVHPDFEQVAFAGARNQAAERPIHDRFVAAPDGGAMDERQMHHVELIFDRARVVRGPVIFTVLYENESSITSKKGSGGYSICGSPYHT